MTAATAGWSVAAALAVLLCLAVVLLVRVRVLANRVGAFECALRMEGRHRWMSGIAVFGDETVEWYRLVSLAPGAKYRLCREGMTLGEVRRRGTSQVLEVPCQVAGYRFDLGMREDSHSALVSWLEAAAPSQPSLF